MSQKSQLRAQARRLQGVFEAAGAQVVETDILQPAKTLLDLYGEDMRARAYVTSDPLRGEMMLRPDFTVPVAQMHMAEGADPARYTYAGEVFRHQDVDADRPSEYLQVGYEVFDGQDPEAADAEVFSLFEKVLAPYGLRAATGDIGILTAAVLGLSTTSRRKAALMRHIWRPRRFRALLDRFGGRRPVPASRTALLDKMAEGQDVFADTGPEIGLRHKSEIEARMAALQDDAAEPAISQSEVELLDDILSLKDTAPMVLERLRDIAVDLPSLAPAIERMDRRLSALAARGVDVASLEFEASYGRTNMEYYDGFVFGFYAPARPDLPAVATGGRYDALTRVLGQGRSIPAVGGVIRPELLAQIQEQAQ